MRTNTHELQPVAKNAPTSLNQVQELEADLALEEENRMRDRYRIPHEFEDEQSE
jgi:hypothetical protein